MADPDGIKIDTSESSIVVTHADDDHAAIEATVGSTLLEQDEAKTDEQLFPKLTALIEDTIRDCSQDKGSEDCDPAQHVSSVGSVSDQYSDNIPTAGSRESCSSPARSDAPGLVIGDSPPKKTSTPHCCSILTDEIVSVSTSEENFPVQSEVEETTSTSSSEEKDLLRPESPSVCSESIVDVIDTGETENVSLEETRGKQEFPNSPLNNHTEGNAASPDSKRDSSESESDPPECTKSTEADTSGPTLQSEAEEALQEWESCKADGPIQDPKKIALADEPIQDLPVCEAEDLQETNMAQADETILEPKPANAVELIQESRLSAADERRQESKVSEDHQVEDKIAAEADGLDQESKPPNAGLPNQESNLDAATVETSRPTPPESLDPPTITEMAHSNPVVSVPSLDPPMTAMLVDTDLVVSASPPSETISNTTSTKPLIESENHGKSKAPEPVENGFSASGCTAKQGNICDQMAQDDVSNCCLDKSCTSQSGISAAAGKGEVYSTTIVPFPQGVVSSAENAAPVTGASKVAEPIDCDQSTAALMAKQEVICDQLLQDDGPNSSLDKSSTRQAKLAHPIEDKDAESCESASLDGEDSKSMTTAQDMPHLEDVSVDTSHDSGFCTPPEEPHKPAVQLHLHLSNDDRVKSMVQESSAALAARTMCSSSSAASSGSFKQQTDPDGDCDFLNQTLNISAINTSAVLSESYTHDDFPSSTSGTEEIGHDFIHEAREDGGDDAPGEVLTNVSKITTEHSLVLPSPTKVEDAFALPALHETVVAHEENAISEIVLTSDVQEDPGKERDADMSVASVFSCISAEQSSDGIELVTTLPPNASSNSFQSSSIDDDGEGPMIEPSGSALLMSSPSSMIMTPHGEHAGKEDTPIARIRSSRDDASKDSAADPDGTLIDRQVDPTVLGGLKKPSRFREDRPKPRVSFAAMHKGPHYESHPRYQDVQSYSQDDDDFEEGHGPSRDEIRRARFAAYLKRRMIYFDEDDEDEEDESFVQNYEDDEPHERCHDGIPRILDPNTMCSTSVESSFTTLVSKADPVEDAEAMFSAIDMIMGRNKSMDESESDSSYCTDSDEDDSYRYEDDDVKSTGFFSSLFSDGDSTREQSRNASEPIQKWFAENISLPPVLQLEDVLKVATDFGRGSRKKKVTQRPHKPDHAALSEFVDELENEEPLHNRPESNSEKEEPPTEKKAKGVRSRSKASKRRELEASFASDTPHECALLTFQDLQELAVMAATAIETGAKRANFNQIPTLAIKPGDPDALNTSSDSTEAAWDRVEHTVNDLESVTGHSQQEKPSAQDRIAAKLEHIKKTQPQVYRVFLAKMAAAEKAGTKFDLRRDDVIRRDSAGNVKESLGTGQNFPNQMSLQNWPLSEASPSTRETQPGTDVTPIHAPGMSVRIHVQTEASKVDTSSTLLPDWESFDGSPFKEPGVTNAFFADRPDDSSILDDMKWLSSAKDSFTSTMESFMGTPKNMTGPLHAKFEQYSKTHPKFYNMLSRKINKTGQKEIKKHRSSTGAHGSMEESICGTNATSKAQHSHWLDCDINKSSRQVEVTEKEFISSHQKGQHAHISPKQQVPQRTRFQDLENDSSPEVEPALKTTDYKHSSSISINQSQPSGPTRNPNPFHALRRRSSTPTANGSKREDPSAIEAENKEDRNPKGLQNIAQPVYGTHKLTCAGSRRKSLTNDKENPIIDMIHGNMYSEQRGIEKEELAHKPLAGKGMLKANALSTAYEATGSQVPTTTQLSGMSVAERSKTPLASNRTGRTQQARSEHSKTPRASNRSEGKFMRPSVIRDVGLGFQSVEPDSMEDKRRHTSSSSKWETFEGSSFKDFVLQSINGPSSKNANGTNKTLGSPPPLTSEANKPKIDLQATFLDSFLPAPPSFSAQPEMHNQQRDPWDFSEAAGEIGEQWEHFSPLSFDSNFTKWGMQDRGVSKSSHGRTQAQRNTRTSPASVAEI